MDTEEELISNAFLQLNAHLEGRLEMKSLSDHDSAVDAQFVIDGITVNVAAKAKVKPINFAQFESLKQDLGEILVVSSYISSTVKDLFKEKGINYIDSSGNIFLRVGLIYIYITGIPNPLPPTLVRTRLFGKVGIQLIFWLLQDPNSINLGYRVLADRANVALGNLPVLFEALQEEGFLVKLNTKEWALTNQERLLDIWMQEFGRRLKPTLLEARFQATQQDFRYNWRSLQLQNGAVWGGEPGANLLTDYLLPANFILYTNAPRQEIMKTYRWAPHPTGNIAVYRKFWKDVPELDEKVSPLLVYADLNDLGEPRGLEVANLIFNQYLQRHE